MLVLMSEAVHESKACDVRVSWVARRLNVSSGSGTARAQGRTAETAGFYKLVSQLDKYRENPVTVRVKVKVYRHVTLIADPVCPKQSPTLIADQTALQSNSLSHFYQFLAEHKQAEFCDNHGPSSQW